MTLTLPKGWVWLKPRPEDCVRFGCRELNCVIGLSWPASQEEIDGYIERATK